MKTKLNQNGFTLIEAVIVITFLGGLIAVLVPNISCWLNDSDFRTTVATAEVVSDYAKIHYDKERVYPVGNKVEVSGELYPIIKSALISKGVSGNTVDTLNEMIVKEVFKSLDSEVIARQIDVKINELERYFIVDRVEVTPGDLYQNELEGYVFTNIEYRMCSGETFEGVSSVFYETGDVNPLVSPDLKTNFLLQPNPNLTPSFTESP